MIIRPEKPTHTAAKGSKGPAGARVLIIEGRFYNEISDELMAGAVAALDADDRRRGEFR